MESNDGDQSTKPPEHVTDVTDQDCEVDFDDPNNSYELINLDEIIYNKINSDDENTSIINTPATVLQTSAPNTEPSRKSASPPTTPESLTSPSNATTTAPLTLSTHSSNHVSNATTPTLLTLSTHPSNASNDSNEIRNLSTPVTYAPESNQPTLAPNSSGT